MLINFKYRVSFEPNECIQNLALNRFIQITPKQAAVLRELCSDLSYKEIGHKLNMSTRTIEAYKNTLCEKIGVKSRVGLVVFALQMTIFFDE